MSNGVRPTIPADPEDIIAALLRTPPPTEGSRRRRGRERDVGSETGQEVGKEAGEKAGDGETDGGLHQCQFTAGRLVGFATGKLPSRASAHWQETEKPEELYRVRGIT